MFLHSGSSELNNHSIYTDWRLLSNHASLTIIIPITEEYIISSKHFIIKDSEKESTFIKDLTNSIRNINTSNILDIASINRATDKFASMVKVTWRKNSKVINITRHSKSWWNESYCRDLEKYRLSKSLEDWKWFWRIVKNMKWQFFDLKIQKIANKKHSPWKLIG